MVAEASFDPGKILAVLDHHDVEYILVGGLGARALSELGARLRVGGMTDAGPIDVLRELRDRDGRDVPFDVLRGRSADQEIGGVVVHVAGLEDIIAAKEFAGRDKDHEALPELRELRDTS